MEDVIKCCLHITKIFNRAWIESCLDCCLFVYIHTVCLFVYIFYINNQYSTVHYSVHFRCEMGRENDLKKGEELDRKGRQLSLKIVTFRTKIT